MWRSVFFPYVNYVLLFLGMGLISGAIVHMPVDPVKYTMISMVGAVMFGFASFINDIRGQENMGVGAIVKYLICSLVLSVGIGMMSGGIQHFSDNPTYAAMLIPLGFGLSLFSFIIKNNAKLSAKRAYAVIAVFIVLALPLKMGLDYLVGTAPTEQTEGGHGGGHGH
ncbi:MAG TPA: hypothetical protein VNT75_01655 [Symbiobacteriaceae bacterium]|nr:hypothetical protein [Symbiobacteriaceae bacterium]